MSPQISIPLLGVLAAGGDRADKVADVICGLVVEGGKRKQLQPSRMMENGEEYDIFVPPLLWFDRLMLAVERGAIDVMPATDIVKRILGEGRKP